MTWIGIGVIVALILIGVVGYWQLIIAEGTYLGQATVTFLYDLAAPHYDQIKHFQAEIEARFLGEPIARELGGPGLVLDIATGTGRMPLSLLNQPNFNGRIVGLDDSLKMLQVAVRHLKPYGDRVSLIWRDARHLPFEDQVFDAVTCLEMLEFTPDPRAQIQEAYRVLRSGGLLVTTRRRGPDARWLPGKTFSRDKFRDILIDMGFDQVTIAPWQIDYDLVWARRSDDSPFRGVRHISEILVCTACGEKGFAQDAHQLVCLHCGAQLRIKSGILHYR